MALKKNLSKRQKVLFVCFVIAFVLIIIYSVATLIYRAGKTKVIIRIAPNAATITLNDTKIANNSTLWLEPGDYKLKASLDEHFDIYERDISLNGETTELYAILNSLDDEGREYVEKHRQEYAVVEGLIGKLTNAEGEKQRKQYPILNYLPDNNSLYSISYEYNDNNEPIINVKTDPEFIDTVVAKMKTYKDIDLSSLNIIFHNENHFSNYQQNPNQDIKKFIRTAYSLSDRYVINDIQQLDKYYYTTAYIHDDKHDLDYAHYRILLKKNKENEWQAISTPQPLLTIYNTPGIDKEVLNTINSY